MKKLIELLNEYRKEKWERNLNEFEVSQTLDSLNYLRLFIKWLVENEKVEWNNKDIAIKEWILWKSIDNYHSLLMALSIQDNPIEFLASILK